MAVIVKKEFLGIQGYGIHRGVPMYFVALQHATDEDAKVVNEKDIIDRAIASKFQWLTIAPSKPGEEPYEQDLDRLAALAFANSLKTFITTHGKVMQHVYVDWISLVPVKEGRIEPEFKKIADEIRCNIKDLDEIDYYIRNYYNPKIPFILNCSAIVENPEVLEIKEKILEKIAGMTNVRVMLI